MSNLLDYLAWRGDLSMTAVPYTDVDALILCYLSYMPYDGIVSEDFDQTLTLAEAAGRILQLNAEKGLRLAYDEKSDRVLLGEVMSSARFSGIRLCGYTSKFCPQREEQFSALCFLLPDGSCQVAYRGTDGSLIGWKEDFNMSFTDVVPAQRDAAAYLARAAEAIDRPLRVGGHSKGGNLAVYASAFAPESAKARLVEVCNFDGPGFSESVASTEAFQQGLRRVRTYLPQSSIVGMLLEHSEDFTILESDGVSIFQHNVYTWQIRRAGFVTVEKLTNSSHFADDTLKRWVASMDPALRGKMINGVYSVLNASDGVRLHELLYGKNFLNVIRAAGEMDAETRGAVVQAVKLLSQSMRQALPDILERMWPELHMKLSKQKEAEI